MRDKLKTNALPQIPSSFIRSQVSSDHYDTQVSDSEDVEYYEDALSNRTMSKEVKDIQRKKLRTVTFTSELFQTLVDDETTVYLSNPVSLSTSGPIKDNLTQEFESHATLNVSKLCVTHIRKLLFRKCNACIDTIHRRDRVRSLVAASLNNATFNA